MKNFFLIGLTGNLGSGKSTVRKMLEKLGARGIDADLLAHAALERGTPAWRAVLDEFGTDILRFNGRVDRQKLGARVFADANALQKLEAIVHPAVNTMTKELLKQTQMSVVVVEAVKLVEAGMHEWCDALWVVNCNSQVQVERVMRDRHMTADAAKDRLLAQGSIGKKLKMATVVIDNSGNEPSTRQQVESAWHSILAENARDKSDWLLGIPPAHVIAPAELPVAVAEPIIAPPTIEPTSTEKLVELPAIEDQVNVPEWAKASFIELPPASTQPPVIEKQTPEPIAPIPTPTIDTPIPPPPIWAQEELTIEVRRMRRSDLDAFADAIVKFENRTQPMSREEAIKRMGERGYRIAVANKRVVALSAWEAENLVAIVREVWVESPDIAPKALPELFKLIEQEARGLACEAAVILMPEDATTLSAQAQSSGYQVSDTAGLHKLWRSVVQERTRPGEQIWLKKLREDMITRPI